MTKTKTTFADFVAATVAADPDYVIALAAHAIADTDAYDAAHEAVMTTAIAAGRRAYLVYVGLVAV